MKRESQEIECRKCETTFNLSAQWYYDDLCPECKASEDGEEKTLPSCPRCQERIKPGSGTTVSVPNRSMRGGSESIYVHKKCEDEMDTAAGRLP